MISFKNILYRHCIYIYTCVLICPAVLNRMQCVTCLRDGFAENLKKRTKTPHRFSWRSYPSNIFMWVYWGGAAGLLVLHAPVCALGLAAGAAYATTRQAWIFVGCWGIPNTRVFWGFEPMWFSGKKQVRRRRETAKNFSGPHVELQKSSTMPITMCVFEDEFPCVFGMSACHVRRNFCKVKFAGRAVEKFINFYHLTIVWGAGELMSLSQDKIRSNALPINSFNEHFLFRILNS